MNYKLFILATVLSLTTACAGNSTFDPAKRLYTSSGVGHPITELPMLLDDLSTTGKPVILFVHGRGKEPNKSLRNKGGLIVEGRAVHKLESGYKAKVLMFNWDSERGCGFKDRERPLSNMATASQAFSLLLDGIKQYRHNNSQARPIALMVHSMGNIVVETMVNNWGGWIDNGGEPLFSNVVFSASDSNDTDHAAWVEKIGDTENVYLTINADDKILKKSNDQRPAGAAALGLEPGTHLARNAVYVDITNLGSEQNGKKRKTKRHELFNKPGMHGQVYVCEFFEQALTGRTVSLNEQNSNEVVSGRRFTLNYNRNESNDCFSP